MYFFLIKLYEILRTQRGNIYWKNHLFIQRIVIVPLLCTNHCSGLIALNKETNFLPLWRLHSVEGEKRAITVGQKNNDVYRENIGSVLWENIKQELGMLLFI